MKVKDLVKELQNHDGEKEISLQMEISTDEKVKNYSSQIFEIRVLTMVPLILLKGSLYETDKALEPLR
jgi:hypothetical protein